MGFWAFMLLFDLIIPLMMLGFGRSFLKKPPEEINMLFGYRTTMSVKNRDTWAFAHRHCGRLWVFCGLGLLIVTLPCLLFVFGQSTEAIGKTGSVLCMVQLAVLIVSIIPTELALKKRFDKDGNRRQIAGEE